MLLRMLFCLVPYDPVAIGPSCLPVYVGFGLLNLGPRIQEWTTSISSFTKGKGARLKYVCASAGFVMVWGNLPRFALFPFWAQAIWDPDLSALSGNSSLAEWMCSGKDVVAASSWEPILFSSREKSCCLSWGAYRVAKNELKSWPGQCGMKESFLSQKQPPATNWWIGLQAWVII